MANTTRQRLIEVGYELFARNGFHAIGLDRILDEVGVSKQTFYNHFECKDDLIIATLARRSEWELETLQRMFKELAGDDPAAQLHALFDVLHAWLNEPDFRGCIFTTAAAEFPSQHDPAHQAAKRHELAIQGFLRDLAERAGARDPRLLAEGLQILMDGALLYRHITDNDQAANVARIAGEMLLQQHLPAGHSVSR